MKNKKLSSSLIIILAIIVIVVGGLAVYKYVTRPDLKNETINVGSNSEEILVVQEKEIEIFNGTDRPIAVMIDNHSDAWPQANLNKAYIVYEIVVEGGGVAESATFAHFVDVQVGLFQQMGGMFEVRLA